MPVIYNVKRYEKRQDDISYRIVSLDSAELRNYLTFDNQVLNLTKENELLEVLQADGSIKLVLSGAQGTIHYRILGEEILLLNSCPRKRLWIRRTDGTGMRYKCPEEWEKRPDSNIWYCRIGSGADVELTGDRYLNAAYSFVRG